MGVESRGVGRRRRVPRSEKFRRERPPRFENKLGQIRCLFQLFGYFGGRLAPADDSSPIQKSVATPLLTVDRVAGNTRPVTVVGDSAE